MRGVSSKLQPIDASRFSQQALLVKGNSNPPSLPVHYRPWRKKRRLELQTRDRLLLRDEVVQIVGASVPTIYHWMAAGLFPRPITVGPRAVRWLESEVYDWIDDRKVARAA